MSSALLAKGALRRSRKAHGSPDKTRLRRLAQLTLDQATWPSGLKDRYYYYANASHLGASW
jgi:hypothetical protein